MHFLFRKWKHVYRTMLCLSDIHEISWHLHSLSFLFQFYIYFFILSIYALFYILLNKRCYSKSLGCLCRCCYVSGCCCGKFLWFSCLKLFYICFSSCNTCNFSRLEFIINISLRSWYIRCVFRKCRGYGFSAYRLWWSRGL